MNELLPAATFLQPLTAQNFDRVKRRYLAHLVSEMIHERMLIVTVQEHGGCDVSIRIMTDQPGVTWQCTAQRRLLDHWSVDAGSIVRVDNAGEQRAGPGQFLVDVRKSVGIEGMTLGRFIEETAQTLYADACIGAGGRVEAQVLAHATYQDVESAMEGHPWVVVNKGRLGFDAHDQFRYAPESGRGQRLVWVAAHRSRSGFWSLPNVAHDEFMADELGAECAARFHETLRREVADPGAYVWIPVHEWQWTHKIVPMFADDFATGKLVFLGVTPQEMRAQQSIRTFFNLGEPRRSYVKTSLSILNTFQVRGLATSKLRLAPLVTQWLRDRFRGDAVLESCGTVWLGEVASASHLHGIFEQIPDGPYPNREMLGALWRESPYPYLREGEELATMAALLYIDDRGDAYVDALARRAGVDLEVWLRAYLRAYLRPLLHCAFFYETFFVAHGENTILVHENGMPTRAVFKDLVEEVQVSARIHQELPPALRELFYHLDDDLLPLFVLTDVFDGFFRYLGNVLAGACEFSEQRFWGLVADEVRSYEQEHPELQSRFSRFDLWRDEFPRFCINKYRMVYHGYAEAADNVHDLSPKFSGTIPNPLGAFR